MRRIEKWDQSNLSVEKPPSGPRLKATELCQTGSDIELTTKSGTTPKEDTGEELRSDSERSLWNYSKKKIGSQPKIVNPF